MSHQERLAAERGRIDSVISDLRDEMAAIEETTAAGPDDEHDAEGSTVAYERARVRALLAHAEQAAAQLDGAARRARESDDTGRGGLRCQLCRQPIPDERLLALPATTTCVTCAAGP